MSNIAQPTQGYPLDSSAAPLAQVTADRLSQFHLRRVRLNSLRGIAITTCVLAVSVLAGVLIDAWIDHLAARWTACTIVYGCTLTALYVLCWRPLREPAQFRSEAARLEKHDPRLKNRLLSAVELAERDEQLSDSPAFRNQLQLQVARLIEPVDARQLLPSDTAQKLVAIAVACALTLGGLCIAPSLHLPQRITRVLFPWANLGRVTNVSIRIERPVPHSLTIPRGEPLAITAIVDGAADADVWLETQDGPGSPPAQMLRVERLADAIPATSDRFETTISTLDEELTYRVLCEGASTPWYRLQTAARPSVTNFKKTILAPQYASLPDNTIVEPHGHVEALIGSRVELGIQANQPITTAELLWQEGLSEHIERRELTWNASENQFETSLEINGNSSYRIVLESAATGFTNEFSPRYNVTAVADHPPVVRWLQPQTQLLAVGPNEIISLSVQVNDELPIETFEQSVRIGEQPWKTTSIGEIRDEASQVLEWTLDLLPLGLSAGDPLELKVAATDRAGNRSESETIRLLVSSTSIDLSPSDLEFARLELARQLRTVADALADQGPQLKGDATRETVRLESESILAELSSALPQLMEQTTSALILSDDAVATQELIGIGNTLSHFRRTEVPELIHRLDEVDLDSEDSRKKFARTIEATTTRFDTLAKSVQALTSHDIARRHLGQLIQLVSAYEAFATEVEADPNQLRRRHQVLNQQVRQIHESMLRSTEAISTRIQKRWRDSAERLGALTDQTERQFDKPELKHLLDLAASVARSLDDSRLISRVDGNFYEDFKQAHTWLHRNETSAKELVGELIRAINAHDVQTDPTKDKLDRTVEQFSERRSLVRSSLRGDRIYASDIGFAKRAIEELAHTGASQPEQIAMLGQLSDSLAVLGAIADLRMSAEMLRQLLKGERWNLAAPSAFTDSPRSWDAFCATVEQAARAGREAGWSNDIVAEIDRLRWDSVAQEAARRITSRRWERKPPTSAAVPLETLSLRLNELLAKLQPAEQLAKATLRDSAPTAAELAQDAAQETLQVSQQTAQLREQVVSETITDPSPELQRLEAQTQQLTQPLQRLREALVDDADARNLLDQNDVEMAARADAAIEMVDRIGETTSNSLAEARLDDTSKEAALGRAAAKQADAAAALQELSEFLDPANQEPANDRPSGSASQTPQTLATDEVQAEAYDQAEWLSRLAQASPEELLRSLEGQLDKNPAMQSEMSDIARKAAQEAWEGLVSATEQQRELQPKLEQSDPDLQAQKELLTHDLQAAREAAFQTIGTLLNEARDTANIGDAKESAQILTEVADRLQTALNTSDGLDAQDSFKTLQAKANLLHTALQDVLAQTEQARQQLATHQQTEVHANGAALKNRRREMKDRQRRVQQQDVRNLQQVERNEKQRLGQLENDVRQAEQRITAEAKRLKQLTDRLAKQPKQESLPPQIAEVRQRLELLRHTKEAQLANRDAVKQRLQEATKALQAANARQPAELDSVNPSAELSLQVTQLAADRSQTLAERLHPWTTDTEPALEASNAALRDARNLQTQVTVRVEDAAATLQRAARHEARLDKLAPAQAIDDIAGEVAQVATNELQAAQQALATAEANAESGQSTSGQASSESSAAARAATANGAAAMARAAEGLKDLLAHNPTPANQSTANASPPSGSSSPDNGQQNQSNPRASLSPQEMAQLLDELDRQINGSSPAPSGQQQSLGPQDNNSLTPSNSGAQPVPQTLAEAARKLASQLSRDRETPPNANEDIGMATEATLANVDPQAPVAVRVLDVSLQSGKWGELRSQRVEGATETQASELAPRYRDEIEAYFRNLSIRSSQGGADEN